MVQLVEPVCSPSEMNGKKCVCVCIHEWETDRRSILTYLLIHSKRLWPRLFCGNRSCANTQTHIYNTFNMNTMLIKNTPLSFPASSKFPSSSLLYSLLKKSLPFTRSHTHTLPALFLCLSDAAHVAVLIPAMCCDCRPRGCKLLTGTLSQYITKLGSHWVFRVSLEAFLSMF